MCFLACQQFLFLGHLRLVFLNCIGFPQNQDLLFFFELCQTGLTVLSICRQIVNLRFFVSDSFTGLTDSILPILNALFERLDFVFQPFPPYFPFAIRHPGPFLHFFFLDEQLVVLFLELRRSLR